MTRRAQCEREQRERANARRKLLERKEGLMMRIHQLEAAGDGTRAAVLVKQHASLNPEETRLANDIIQLQVMRMGHRSYPALAEPS